MPDIRMRLRDDCEIDSYINRPLDDLATFNRHVDPLRAKLNEISILVDGRERFISESGYQKAMEAIESFEPNLIIIKTPRDGRILGALSFSQRKDFDKIWIEYMGVLFNRQGLGTELIKEISKIALRERKSLWVETDTCEGKAFFHKKIGMRKVNRDPYGFYFTIDKINQFLNQ